MTGKAFLKAMGIDPDALPREELMAFGRDAARIAASLGLVGIKRREDGFNVHTWPRDVWNQALELRRDGERPAPRPASQRQVAWLTCLAIKNLGIEEGTTWAMAHFGGHDAARDEDWVARKIQEATR